MGDIIDILSKQPHLTGKASCLSCSEEWVAVAPLGTIALDCPKCKLTKGVFKSLCAPETAWQCRCGCSHFFVSPANVVCALCGTIQVLPD